MVIVRRVDFLKEGSFFWKELRQEALIVSVGPVDGLHWFSSKKQTPLLTLSIVYVMRYRACMKDTPCLLYNKTVFAFAC